MTMDMTRRSALLTAIAGGMAPLVPHSAAEEEGFGHLVEWVGASKESEHAHMAMGWIIERVRAKVLYLRDEFLGSKLKLIAPTFRVVPGKPIWNWMTGYTKQNGLAIFVRELGYPIVSTGMFTSEGYEEYFGSPRPDDTPLIGFKAPWMKYDDRKLIEEVLPKGHIDMDTRWLDYMAEQATKKKEQETA